MLWNFKRGILTALLVFTIAGCGAEGGGGTNVSVNDIGNVEGTVTDISTNVVLSGVTIQIGDKTATTGTNGVYSITDLAVGSRTITATKTAYQNYNATVTVTKGTTVTQNIQLTLTGTGDTTPPTVSSTDPTNNTTGVAVNKAITVTFSEAMDCSTITSSSFTVKDNLNTEVGGIIITCSNTTAVFTPSSNLANSTLYAATITTGVKDSAGNAMAANYTWSFTTGTTPDTTPPTVSSISPANSATAVAVNTGITATFSETMTESTVNTATFTLNNGVTGTVTYNGTTATFTPSSNLAYATTYTATVTTGVKDSAGNAMAGNYTWQFTTGSTLYQMGGSIQGSPLNLTNTVTTIAGSAGIHGSTDGTGTAARFFSPNGITTDGTNLFIADGGDNTIRKIVISSGVVTTIAGSAGVSGSIDGTGTAARFYHPYAITTDGANLFVADTGNNTIRKLVISSGAVTTIAGSAGVMGTTDGTGTESRFYYVNGISTDGTNLFVADTGNYTIRKIVISSGVVTTIAGSASVRGTTDGTGTTARFNYPYGITTDGTNLFVADGGGPTIRKIVISSGVVTTIAGNAGVFGSTDGIGPAATFGKPYSISTDGINIFVTDSCVIRKILISSGVVTTIAGVFDVPGSADATGATARFKWALSITTDGTNLFVADRDNYTIRKIQ